MPTLDNPQHEKFVQELVKGKSNADAYLAAGYKAKNASVASAAATRLLNNVKIADRVAELQKRAEEKAVLSKAWVIQTLIENVNRAMTAKAVTDREGEPTGEYTYQGNVANRALELLGKELGMFVERSEVGKPGDFDQMSDDELATYIASESEQLLKPQRSGSKGKTKH